MLRSPMNLLPFYLKMPESEKNLHASELTSSLNSVMKEYEKESSREKARSPQEQARAVELLLDELLTEQKPKKTGS